MLNARFVIILAAIAASVSVQVLAQQSATTNPPGVATVPGNPNLTVATVKLDGGIRASKVVGAAAYVGDEKVGSVDDLVITAGDKVTVAVVSMGGVLGVGSKLVALPYEQLKAENDRVILQGVTKDALNAMPSFTY